MIKRCRVRKVANIKRVLFITHCNEQYGANKSLKALMMDLKNRYDIYPVLVCPNKGDFFYEMRKEEIEVISLDIKTNIWMTQDNRRGMRDVARRVLHFFRVLKSVWLLNSCECDLVYCNTSVSDLGWYISKIKKIPLIWHLREFGDLDYNYRCIYPKHIWEKRLSDADCLIAISDAIADYYEKKVPNAKIKKVYNGINMGEYDSADKKIDVVRFCVAGVLSENKNQLEVLKAARVLKEKIGNKFEIHIVGDGNTDYSDKLKSYVKNNNLEEIVEFWGYRDDMDGVLKSMSIGVVPSTSEAFGRVSVEFMLHEMPVIGTNTGATKEIIEEDKCGRIYELGNVEELAGCMKDYVLNPDIIERHGKYAKEIAKAKFSITQNTDNIYKIIQTV